MVLTQDKQKTDTFQRVNNLKKFQRWKTASYYINYPGPKEPIILEFQRNFRVDYWQVRPGLLERYIHTDTYRYIPSKSAVSSLIERTKGDIPDRSRGITVVQRNTFDIIIHTVHKKTKTTKIV